MEDEPAGLVPTVGDLRSCARPLEGFARIGPLFATLAEHAGTELLDIIVAPDAASAKSFTELRNGCLLVLTTEPKVLADPNLTKKFNVGIDIP